MSKEDKKKEKKDDDDIGEVSYTYWKRDSDIKADHKGFQPQATATPDNIDQNKIIDDLIQKIISFDIPGVESKKEIKKIKPKKEMEEIIEINDNKSIERSIMSDIKSETKIPNMYKNVKKGSYRFYKDKDNAPINLIIQNTTNKSWPENKIKLVCNKELSEIMPSKIDNFKYEIGIGQDGDFSLHFDQKDLKEGKYKIFIELYLNGNKIPDSECPITIRVKPNK